MTNTTKKLTKADHFRSLLAIPAVAENQTLVDFINHELEMLAKKNNSDSGKAAEVRKANDGIQSGITDWMEEGKLYMVTDLIKDCPACAGLSHPKVTAMLHDLIKQERIVRTEEKRKAYFSLAQV